MNIIKKYLKLIILIITCILVYVIYTNNSDKKYINYISLGDGFAKGLNPYEKKSYGYSDFLKYDFNSKNILNSYYNYGESDIRIKDLYNEIIINKESYYNKSIKQALREANILTISIGLNDLIYRKNIESTIKEEEISKKIIIDLDELINEIKKYYKRDIYLIGYYNFYQQGSIDNKMLNILNNKYKKYAKRNNIIYIDNNNMNNKLNMYLDNPNSYYPNTNGYKAIYQNILLKLN